MDIKQYINELGQKAYDASRIMAATSTQKKNDELNAIADEVKSVCNAVWTTAVKDAWKAKLIADKPSDPE